MKETIKSLEERLDLAALQEGKLQESLATTNHKLVTTLETKDALEIDLTTTQRKLERAHADIEQRDRSAGAESTRLQMETEMATLKASDIELLDKLGASKLSCDNLRQDLEVARSRLRDMASARADLKTRLAHKVQYGNDLVQQVKLMGEKIKKIEETNKMQAEKLKLQKKQTVISWKKRFSNNCKLWKSVPQLVKMRSKWPESIMTRGIQLVRN